MNNKKRSKPVPFLRSRAWRELRERALERIFTKCKDSKLAASICNQRCVGPGFIDAKSTHMILELL